MAHQSLYRRYRPQTFAQVRGQSHVVTALRSAVAEDRTAHAYLFSGPRGTGKTTTARILAKALNCPNVTDGDPCGVCESCVAIETGKSFDLHELDAASNNKVDDVRDLIGKVNLGTPGRTKVYILDEVHMLTAGAENALLKTLEEPPDHVVFVLATTEPHKVVPTIRSRTQHFEFRLLSGDELAEHVRFVVDDAGLDVDEDGIEYALRRGGGSARDTLSALDLVAATGAPPDAADTGAELADAIGASDPGAAIAAIQRALENGREPRVIGEITIDTLRSAFLASMGSPLTHLSQFAREEAFTRAERIGPAVLTRAMEAVGGALVDMRQAPDPRIPLEVAALRLTDRSSSDSSALAARIEHLEAEIDRLKSAAPSGPGPAPTPSAPPVVAEPAAPSADSGSTPQAPAPATPAAAGPRTPPPVPTRPEPVPEPAAEESTGARPGDVARAKLHAVPSPGTAGGKVESPAPAPAPAAAPNPPRDVDLAEIQQAAHGDLFEHQKTKARFKTGRFSAVNGTTVTFAVPNEHFVGRAVEAKAEAEAALSARFGQPVSVEVIVDPESEPDVATSTPVLNVEEEEAEIGPVDELDDADVAASGIERLTQAFPGSTLEEHPGP